MALRPGAVTQNKIDFSRSFWDRLIELPLSSATTYSQEGSLMIETTQTGSNERVAAVSGGTAKEKFIGVAISDYRRITDFVNVERCTIPSAAAYTFQLNKTTPTSGTYYIEDITVPGTPWTDASPGAPAATTQYSVSAGGLVTFHSSDAGTTVDIRYTYTPTTVELQSRFHERPVVAQAQTFFSQVAIAVGYCEVYTTMYNTANTWTVGAAVYQGASGKCTTTTTGVQVIARVLSIPSTTDVFLGIGYNVSPGVMGW